jgi:hypothetical protein
MGLSVALNTIIWVPRLNNWYSGPPSAFREASGHQSEDVSSTQAFYLPRTQSDRVASYPNPPFLQLLIRRIPAAYHTRR